MVNGAPREFPESESGARLSFIGKTGRTPAALGEISIPHRYYIIVLNPAVSIVGRRPRMSRASSTAEN